jgi:hypothetical protein
MVRKIQSLFFVTFDYITGARSCIDHLKSIEKDTIQAYNDVSQIFRDNCKKSTRHLNNDQDLAEYPLIKQQLITLASMSKLLADCFDNARGVLEQQRASITQSPKCTLEHDLKRVRKQVDINNKRRTDCTNNKNKVQYELDKVTNQLNDVVLTDSKRSKLELERNTLEGRLQQCTASIKSANSACKQAENHYKQDASIHVCQSQIREFEELKKLNEYMWGYIQAVQIPSCKNRIRDIGNQLISEDELKQDLKNWQRKWIGTTPSSDHKRITSGKQHSASYAVEEPSSDDDDEEDDNATALVRYEASPRSHRRRQ